MDLEHQQLLAPIYQFLKCETPEAWIEEAIKPERLSALLVDHANCELKAAQSAALLIRRYAIDKESGATLLSWLKPYEDFVYRQEGDGIFSAKKNALIGSLKTKDLKPETQDLLDKMVRLIKEELHHFEQVLEIMQARDIPYEQLSAARYAKGLIKHVRTYEPAAAVDKLIIGAFIEARSCERFAKLAPYLDAELEKFYISLLRSEARHYQDYLKLAATISADGLEQRIAFFAEQEALLMTSEDDQFRFHSGVPTSVFA
ncbi:tRNA-(ms[2]io[6]A)-hydroxylase [Corallincola luteus]|uniref:tRNA-(Ms[2]io[6]A)-hydroxylase n=2 Tax=Corallincola TaxID=1775176 RepID=A0A368N083_9GAMM|nr:MULTISPECIES: tRNA isopentenyl-2-thiomethyl-A-37 hydroxylase MiaE [Corallincola]RCU43646.1 tRNA-(ms[2]io[6]A)-hydroxylase [Corallincola holothuriorum]TCI01626.1 tRNA-(ms[2]io[6]A)-hydroxylase [Corallincola luteus]